MLGVRLPCGDRLEGRPVRHGDAEPRGIAHALDPEKPRLLRGELDHAIAHRAVAVIDLRAPRREDHREVRRLRRPGEAGLHRSQAATALLGTASSCTWFGCAATRAIHSRTFG